MSWTQISCQYDGTFAGFLSSVFDCYVNHEEPVEFRTPDDPCCSLYPLRTVLTHPDHAKRVYRSLAARFGRAGQLEQILQADKFRIDCNTFAFHFSVFHLCRSTSFITIVL